MVYDDHNNVSKVILAIGQLQALQIPLIARPFSIKSDYIHNHYTDEMEDERKIPISKTDNKS